MQDFVNPSLFDFSPYFTITNEKFLRITSPVANTTFRTGNTVNITWETDTPYHTVSIDLMSDNTSVLQITKATSNVGLFKWDIPIELRGDTSYYLYIRAIDDSVKAQGEIFAIIPDINIPGYEIPLLLLSAFFVSLCILLAKQYGIHKKYNNTFLS